MKQKVKNTEPVRIDKEVIDQVRRHKEKTGIPISSFIEQATKKELDGGIVALIKKDEELFMTWQANIAMAIKDEFGRWKKKKKFISIADMHQIANKGAKDFLNILIK